MLGLDGSYDYSAIIFFIIGMVFGQSYNINYVRPLNWVHTSRKKRLTRTILGVIIAASLYAIPYQLLKNDRDQSTIFYLKFALPAFFISFTIYGIYPIFCKKIGLVEVIVPVFEKPRSRSTVSRSKSTSDIAGFMSPLSPSLQPRQLQKQLTGELIRLDQT